MKFDVNSPILYALVALVIAAVLAQSVFFLVKAWKHGREIGMDMERLKKTAGTAAGLTIAPAIAIGISGITLA